MINKLLFISSLSLLMTTLFTACDGDSDDDEVTQHATISSYTKLDSAGIPLSDQSKLWRDSGDETVANQWSCVLDNTSGLVWEIKTNDGGLRDRNWTYMNTSAINSPTNWNPDTDGGYDRGSCSFDIGDATSVTCDTQKYINAVNDLRLCGRSDWRLPSVDVPELRAVFECSGADDSCSGYMTIDNPYFPQMDILGLGPYWSSSAYNLIDDRTASYVYFGPGGDFHITKHFDNRVRLVSDI